METDQTHVDMPDMVTHVFKMKVNEFTVDARKELPLVLSMHHFRQVLPVVESGSMAEILKSSLIRSPLWHHVSVLRLRENMRLSNPSLSVDERTNLDMFAQ
ncbi:hypothetical protein ACQ4PT_045077 [Festuca glaucescens]